MSHQGAAFVKNYLSRQWSKDRKQTTWSLQPNEAEVHKVQVLYNIQKDVPVFGGFQFLFEIEFHEEHPYKAPSIRALTPNGRFKENHSVCIDGLTAWHPESWNIITSFPSIVERFVCAFVDIENVKFGAGFIHMYEGHMEYIAQCVANSAQWNKTHYKEVVLGWQEQCDDILVEQLSDAKEPSSTGSSVTADEVEDCEYEYDSD
jgi:ubiquitin-protein ligase